MSDRRFCTYIHFRESDGRPFYVGKGKISRAFDFRNRSAWWKRIAAKNGVSVKIVMKDSHDSCCIALEKILIKKIGRENLCNMTDGGDGASGMKQSEYQKQKMREFNKGRPLPRLAVEKSVAKRIKPIGTECGLRFESITDAARFLKRKNIYTTVAGIRSSANGITNSAYGYKWGYLVAGEIILTDPCKGRVYTGKKVRCSNGLIFNELSRASDWLKENGVEKADVSSIVKVCKGKRKSAFGYGWSYV